MSAPQGHCCALSPKPCLRILGPDGRSLTVQGHFSPSPGKPGQKWSQASSQQTPPEVTSSTPHLAWMAVSHLRAREVSAHLGWRRCHCFCWYQIL